MLCLPVLNDTTTNLSQASLKPTARVIPKPCIVIESLLSTARIQKERFSSSEAYDEACKNYVVNDKTMHHAKARMAVLHPLPR